MPSAFGSALTPSQVIITVSGFPSAYDIQFSPTSVMHIRNVTGINGSRTCPYQGFGNGYVYLDSVPSVSYEVMWTTDGIDGAWNPVSTMFGCGASWPSGAVDYVGFSGDPEGFNAGLNGQLFGTSARAQNKSASSTNTLAGAPSASVSTTWQ